MKNSKKISRKIASAISLFVLFVCWSNALFAQSTCPSGITITNSNPCFTISATCVTNGGTCNDGGCGPNPNAIQYCVSCVDVTVTSICNDLPIHFEIFSTSSEDCHTVCSPSGDFTMLAGGCAPSSTKCSYCDPRDIDYAGNSGNGLQYGHTATFRICHRYDTPTYVPETYHIYLPSHGCGTPPTTCDNTNAAVITF